MIDIRTGIDAKDYSNVAKQEHLDVLEVELKKLEDEVTQVRILFNEDVLRDLHGITI